MKFCHFFLASAMASSLQPRYAAAYGDPHFHIKGKNEYQPDLCFDYLNKKSDMTKQQLLLNDNETGFSIYAQTFKPFEHSDQLYFRDLWLTSRHNITLHVTSRGISLAAFSTFGQRHRVEPSIDFEVESTKYGDAIIGKVRRNGSNGQFTVSITFINGPSLTISTGKHSNVNFTVEGGYLSEDLSGVLGPFMSENGYRIIQDEDEPNTGVFFTDQLEARVSFKRHNHDRNCWTLSNDDIRHFMHKRNLQ